VLNVDEAMRLAAAAGLDPDREEFRMYLAGVTPRQMAAVSKTHVNFATRRLRAYWYAIPGLKQLHESMVPDRPPKVHIKVDWLRRRDDVEAFHASHGKLPVARGTLPDEHRLRAWINRQRKAETDGKLTPEQIDLMNRIPGWRDGKAQDAVARARHNNRLEELVRFHKQTGRWPQYKSDEPGERALGMWLHGRRSYANQGNIDPDLFAALNARVPGWRGRQHKPAGAQEPA